MKAEQRKELETNILADKMGRVVERVKASPRRAVTIYFVLAGIVVVGLVFAYRWYRQSVQDTALNWVAFDDGPRYAVESLAEKEGDTPVGKAARFQLAWYGYWDYGIKRLGVDAPGALKAISASGRAYRELLAISKDDSVFEPQAMLGVAVCEEALAVQDRLRLDKAVTLYDELAKHEKYKDTAEGRFAQGRLELLRDKNGKVRAEASNTYAELQAALRIPDLRVERDIDLRQPPLAIPPMLDPDNKDK